MWGLMIEESYISKIYSKSKEIDGIVGKGGEVNFYILLVEG